MDGREGKGEKKEGGEITLVAGETIFIVCVFISTPLGNQPRRNPLCVHNVCANLYTHQQ